MSLDRFPAGWNHGREDLDSQVQYYEPAKYVAKLRDYNTSDNPILFKVNLTAGHGGVSGRFASLEEVAMEYAFLLRSDNN